MSSIYGKAKWILFLTSLCKWKHLLTQNFQTDDIQIWIYVYEFAETWQLPSIKCFLE